MFRFIFIKYFLLDKIEIFYDKYVKSNKNMFLDDIYGLLFICIVKKSLIKIY